ncbi:MAG: restriction endonuclease subunit S [Phascolarctobacterium sp.]|uniref:restriction endonuclease subunit S n=1 Tax=Phascolarctobacterium sp. TaxID=2049039 RepID=UPI0026DA80D1|nr:restriction endonuclease subunit S [Phascolarctobacterium sp.]MDO4920838.1 restriction endonuclease subunit S [Phascolarctobacterium sp.]
MSRLSELIRELCPDGVEYKKLGEVATVYRGGNFQKKDFVEQGVPCIHYGQIYTRYNLFTDKTLTFISKEKAEKQKIAVKNDIIMAVTSENIEDVCKCVAWLGDENVAVSGHSAIIHHSLDAKYLTYFFHSKQFFSQKRKLAHGTKVIEVTPDSLNSVILPVPPLEVQREIVRVLDKFTFYTAELTAELTARKKQYECYRDKLLNFEEWGGTSDVVWRTLGDVCSVVAGGTPSKKNDSYWVGGNIKWLGSTVCKNQKTVDEVTGYITEKGFAESSAKIMKAGTTLIALVGATIGKVAFLPFEASINQNIAGIYPKDTNTLNPSYLYYACTALYPKFLALTHGSKLTMANMEFVRSLKVAVPSIEIQNRIVNVLDRFDALCNDLTSGLPAEIALRQKQYEYYRDKLLDFKRLDA